jgi:hypothetical protein
MILAEKIWSLCFMSTTRLLVLSLLLLFSSPSALAEKGYTGLRIGEGARVQEVFNASPAWRAGVRPGDAIESVDNVLTKGLKFQELVDRITGPMGTRVSLVIVRGGKRYTCVLVRGNSQSDASDAGRTNGPVAVSPSSSPSKIDTPPIVSIEIFRKTNDTDKTLIKVKDALSQVPTGVQEALKRSGISVLIVPTILAARPELRNEKPRGYHGGGYDNCAGLYYASDKKVFISDRVSYRNSPYQENWYLIQTAMHEFGHAYDHTASYSTAESFVKAYEDDGKYLGNEQRNKFEYFLQENDAGRSEMFAELFQAILSPGNDADAVKLSQAFPRCTAAVREAIGYIPGRK